MNIVNEKPFETLQQVFEIGVMRLLRQGSTTKSPDFDHCVYRTNDGTKACLMGLLIPDEALDEDDYFFSIKDLLSTDGKFKKFHDWAQTQPVFSITNAVALIKIQALHDLYCSNLETFVSQCRNLAQELNLDASFLETEEAKELLKKFTFFDD